jgi:hypothetical protein
MQLNDATQLGKAQDDLGTQRLDGLEYRKYLQKINGLWKARNVKHFILHWPHPLLAHLVQWNLS